MKIAESTYGYYPDMQRALKAIARQESMEMISEGDMTLREAIDRMDELDQRFLDMFVESGADY